MSRQNTEKLPSPAAEATTAAVGHNNYTVANSVVMSGDGWRRRHDQVKWTGDHWLSHALIEHTTEVNGLFAATINQEAAKNIDEWKRQGLVPDFGITRMTATPWSSGNSNV